MVKLNKIYTRTGDDGSTGLVDGSRVAKDDPRMAAIGEVDELNSTIGSARIAVADGTLDAALQRIQNDLFDLGADLATPGHDFAPSDTMLRIVEGQVDWLESQIDRATATLQPLTSFILPGGNAAAAALHVARAVARRAERALVTAAAHAAINPAAMRYINRLSDFLFVVARSVNANGEDDILWTPGGSR